MSDSVSGTGRSGGVTERRKFGVKYRAVRFQWSLSTLLLLMGLIGVWTTYFVSISEIAKVEAENELLSRLSRELRISNPSQYAIVNSEERWPDVDTWEVYLPPRLSYALKLSTRQIGEVGFPEEQSKVILESGRHVIELEVAEGDSGWNVTVFVDDSMMLRCIEPSEWKPAAAGSLSSSEYPFSRQLSTDDALVLKRSQFIPDSTVSFTTPIGPSNGILLWIETDREEEPDQR